MLTNLSMSVITSAYGIDIRKKLYMVRPNTANGNDFSLDMWLRGNLDIKSLQNVAFKYKEELEDSYGKMEKSYNEMTAPIREALNFTSKLFKGISLGKSGKESNADSGNAKDDTRMALMEFAAAIAAVGQGVSSNEGDEILAQQMAEQLNILPRYNIPVRTKMPSVSIPFGKGIKVIFATGSCNWWNAYEEVYKPIRCIMNAVFPRAKVHPKYSSLYTLNNANNVIPFEIQSKWFLLTELPKAAKNAFGEPGLLGTAKDLMDSGKEAVEVVNENAEKMEALKAEKALLAAEASRLEASQQSNDVGLWDSVTSFFTRQPAPTKGQKNAKKQAEVDAEMGKIDEAVTKACSLVISTVGSLANFGAGLIGGAQQDMFDAMPITTICICPVPKDNSVKDGPIFFSIDDCCEAIAKRKYEPLFSIRGILSSMEVEFDFSDVDEQGYPNKGTISIDQFWAVESMGMNIRWRNTYRVEETTDEVPDIDADAPKGAADTDKTDTKNRNSVTTTYSGNKSEIYSSVKKSGKSNWEQIAELNS